MLKSLWTKLTWKCQYFKPAEFTCKCSNLDCDAVVPQQILLSRLDELRARMGIPLSITSGCRCIEHNKAVGGATNSAHIYGLAVDLDTSKLDSVEKLKIFSISLDLFEGVGIGQTFIHVDLKHATKLRWEYDSNGKAVNYRRFD